MADGAAPTAGMAGVGLDDRPEESHPTGTPPGGSPAPTQHHGAFSARATADTDTDAEDIATAQASQPNDPPAVPEPRALSDEAANGAALALCYMPTRTQLPIWAALSICLLVSLPVSRFILLVWQGPFELLLEHLLA